MHKVNKQTNDKPGPGRHGELLLLDEVVGDGGAAVPAGVLPLQHEGVRPHLAEGGEARRVGPVAHLQGTYSEVSGSVLHLYFSLQYIIDKKSRQIDKGKFAELNVHLGDVHK